VENGILKTVLTSSEPVRGVLQNTGNLRERGVTPSNLFLVAQKSSSPEELKALFLDMVKRRRKPYGIVIRRLGDPSFRVVEADLAMTAPPSGQQDRLEPAIMAYRVYLDGHEELIRNAGISGVSLESLKELVGVSNTKTVYSAPFSNRGGSTFIGSITAVSGTTVVSYVVPSSLLFEELAVQKPSGEIPKPPVSKHPYFDK
jgi:hypothetical protein